MSSYYLQFYLYELSQLEVSPLGLLTFRRLVFEVLDSLLGRCLLLMRLQRSD